MAMCPRCHYEYDHSVLVCPDCRLPLEEHPPARRLTAAMVPDDSWVLVGGVSSLVESKVAKGSLESNNIPAILLPLHLSALSGAGFMLNVDRPPDGDEELIMVPREFREEAVMVLRTVLGETFDEAEIDNP